MQPLLPHWINLCAALTVATVLASLVGVTEIMTLAGRVLAVEDGPTDPLMPLHDRVLLRLLADRCRMARPTVRPDRPASVPA